MFRKVQSTERRYPRLLLAALLLFSFLPVRAQVSTQPGTQPRTQPGAQSGRTLDTQPSAPAPAPAAQKFYTAKPNTIPLGATRTVVIMATDKSDLDPGMTIDQDTLDSGIEIVRDSKIDKNRMSVGVKVDDSFQLGPTQLTLLDKNKKVAGMVEFNVTPITRKPTPAGISEVDAMWSILPDEVVKYNFGSKVAKNFYGIEVVIGNNSGFDMQLASVGFRGTFGSDQTLEYTDANGKQVKYAKTYDVPTSDQKLVRGTIERERVYGKRAMVTSFISGFGPFFGGFLPFFHAANAKANFGSFSSLLNGQFKEGVNLFAPDLTVGQLGRLENQAMHEDMIIPNNSQKRTVTFLPKRIIRVENGKRLKDYTATELMDRLGDIVLVGRPVIRFENREIVVEQNTQGTGGDRDDDRDAGTPPVFTPPPAVLPPTILDLSPNSGIANEIQEVTIKGANFASGAAVTFDNTTVQSRFDSPTQLTVTAPKHTAGSVRVRVSNPGTTTPADSQFRYFETLKLNGTSRPDGPIAGGTEIKIFGAGFLPGLKVMFGDKEVPAADVKVSDDGNTITVKTPARDSQGAVNITVVNPAQYPGTKSVVLQNAFTYTP